MKVKRGILFSLSTLLWSVVFPAFTFAHPLINEFSSSTSDDWIELYNPTDNEIDLSVYRIRDGSGSEVNKIDLSGQLPAGAFVIFGKYNILDKGGDSIKLVLQADEANSVDSIIYGEGEKAPLPLGNETIGRREDGIDDWVIFSVGSKGTSNNSAQIFSTPTPTPSPTLTPTRTPTPTNTPTPTRTPTPTKAFSVAVLNDEDVTLPLTNTSQNREVEFKPSEYPEAVLSTESAKNTGEKKISTPTTLIKNAKDTLQENKITSVFVIVGAILLICCGILIFHNQRKSASF